jgi:hypothetical protein
MVQIELDKIVKNKLESYKDKEGCKTYSEAVNVLLSKVNIISELQTILKENQQLLKENQKLIKNYENLTPSRVNKAIKDLKGK